MERGSGSEQAVTTELRMMLTWKASGRYQMENFWVKQCTVTHKYFNGPRQVLHVTALIYPYGWGKYG